MPEAKGFTEQSNSQQTIAPASVEEAASRTDWCGALLDSIHDALIVVDRQSNILLMNEAWKCLGGEFPWLHIEEGHLIFDGEKFAAACTEAEFLVAGVQRVMQGAEPEFEHEMAILFEGKRHWYHVRARELAADGEHPVMISLGNVTARHQAEEEQRELRTLFQRITESTGDAFFMYDPQGRFLMHNAAAMELIGMNDASVIGKNIDEVLPPEQARIVRAQNELALATERTLGYELTMETPRGRRVALVKKGVYRNHQNQPVGIIGIARDITERKLAEEKLQRSEHHFRALIERSADVVALAAGDGAILFASQSLRDFCGFSPEEMIGTNVFFWVHPEDTPWIQNKFRDLCETPEGMAIGECRFLCKDGQWKWIEVTATNRLNDPSVCAVVINSRDITERKKSEQTLRRFEAIVESSLDGIFSIDVAGKIISWNPAAEKIFGKSAAEMLDKHFQTLFSEESLKSYREFNSRIMRGKAIENCETVFFGHDGRRVDLSLTFSPILNIHRIHSGFAVIARDITERRQLEKQVLEIADFEKHRMGQDLHDDLCQHLVGISMIGNLLYNELVKNGVKQAEDARQITEMIRTAVEHARAMAKGLSPLSLAQGGIMGGLSAMSAHTEKLFRVPCAFECPEPVQIEDIEVATQFYRIVQEAVHNAVKHSEGTRVRVRLRSEGGAAVVTVSDDGVGVSEHTALGTGGGLGMHTMQYRAKVIGATLEIGRNVEGGTDVTCRLPLSR